MPRYSKGNDNYFHTHISHGKDHPFWGKHHTEETKKILKEKCSGENSSRFIHKTFKFKCIGCGEIFELRNTYRNKHRQYHSIECKKKYFKHTDEFNKKQSDRYMGDKSNTWLGGREEFTKREADRRLIGRKELDNKRGIDYIKMLILKGIDRNAVSAKDIPQSLIDLKRAQLKIEREARNVRKDCNDRG